MRLLLLFFVLGINLLPAGVVEDRARLKRWVEDEQWERVGPLAERLLESVNDRESGKDLEMLVRSLLARGEAAVAETRLRAVILAKVDNWKVWWAAARIMEEFPVRYGARLDDGRFIRGAAAADGQGEEVWSGDRDRIESVRWYLEAWQRGGSAAASSEQLELLEQFARVLNRNAYGWMIEGGAETPLPDYGEAAPRFPSFEAINVIIRVPESPWEAKNDGELFRWALEQAKALKSRPAAEYDAAFGEALMNHYGLPRGHAVDWWSPDPEFEDRLRKLGDLEVLDEGVVRSIVSENAFLPLLEEAAMSTRPADSAAERARQRISSFRRARLQYDSLAALIRRWLEVIPREPGDEIAPEELAELGQAMPETTRSRWISELETLLGVHVEIPQLDRAFPVGRAPEMTLLVQNAGDLVVSAQPIDLRSLLKRIEDYLRSNPKDLEAARMDLEYMQEMILLGGWRDLLGNDAFRNRYVVAQNDWHRPMPRKIRLPLNRGGPWMVSYELPSGDQYFQLVWMADLAAVMHHGAGSSNLVVVDARDGRPVKGGAVTALGWKELRGDRRARRILVSKFRRFADPSGRVSFPSQGLPSDFSWMLWIEAGGKLAVLPELSRFRPERMASPQQQLRVLSMASKEQVIPGETVQLAFFLGRGNLAPVPAGDSPLAGNELEVRLRADGLATGWQAFRLNRYGAGRVTLRLPSQGEGDMSYPKEFRIELRSDSLPELARQVTPSAELEPDNSTALVTGVKRLQVMPQGESVKDLSMELAGEGGSNAETVRLLLKLPAGVQPATTEGMVRSSLYAKAEPPAIGTGEVQKRDTLLAEWQGKMSGGIGEISLELGEFANYRSPLIIRSALYLPGSTIPFAAGEIEWQRNDVAMPILELDFQRRFVLVGEPFEVRLKQATAAAFKEEMRGEVLLERRFQNGFELVEARGFEWREDFESLVFSVMDPGNYRLRFVLAGREDEMAGDGVDLVAVDSKGGGARIWSSEPEGSDALVKLIAAEPIAQAGEKAVILVQSRWPAQDVLLFHGNSVIGYELTRIRTENHGALVELQMRANQEPGITVIAFAVRLARLGRDELSLEVRGHERQLAVKVERRQGELALRLLGADGNAVPGTVALRIADAIPDCFWRSSHEVFWGWENPAWWGLSHSLRSFGSRGFSDILRSGGTFQQAQMGASGVGRKMSSVLSELPDSLGCDLWRGFWFLEVPDSGEVVLKDPALEDSGEWWVEVNGLSSGLRGGQWRGILKP